MSVALDLGAFEMRSMWFGQRELLARRCRSIGLLIENSDVLRTMLRNLGTPFTLIDGRLATFGDSAVRLSEILQLSTFPLLPDGRLPTDDSIRHELISAVVESLIGRADRRDDVCTLILPGVCKAGASLEGREKEMLIAIVRRLGFIPRVVNAPKCLVFAELAQHALTGIGMTFGAATCEFSLIHRERELAHCTVGYSGDWIDRSLSRSWNIGTSHAADDDLQRIRKWKEGVSGSLLKPGDDDTRSLADLCRKLIDAALDRAADSLRTAMPAGIRFAPICLVAAGGTTRLPGFRQLLEESLAEKPLPVPIAQVRVVNETDFTVARGALIQAELLSQSAMTAMPAVA